MNPVGETIMDLSASLLKRTVEEARAFTGQLLGLHPSSIFAALHERSLLITLQDILPQVEREHSCEKHIAELVSQNYIASYNAVKTSLEATIAKTIGKDINHSALLIDPKANVGTILCTVSI